MNADQRKALQESIEHWRDNAEREAHGEDLLIGAAHCACCAYAMSITNPGGSYSAIDCAPCPIRQYTEQAGCRGTPYYAIVDEGAPAELMLDWLIELEAGGTPEILEEDE